MCSLSSTIRQTTDKSYHLRKSSSQLCDHINDSEEAIAKRRKLEDYYDEYDFNQNETDLSRCRSEMNKLIDYMESVISDLNGLMERGYEIPEREKRDCESAIESAMDSIKYAEDTISRAKEVLDQI